MSPTLSYTIADGSLHRDEPAPAPAAKQTFGKIVVAPDSFKGSLSAAEAVEAVRCGILEADPTCRVACVPLGDGGEGTARLLVAALDGRLQRCLVQGPLGADIDASYGIVGTDTAIIEMAAAAGLSLIAPDARNPLHTTTYGVGELVDDALGRGCRRFLLCIGGSATNDAGMGMLQALGYRFFDSRGRLLGRGGAQLQHVARIDASGRDPRLAEATFTVACDVQNPFYGPDGAACVFARQKGADDAMVSTLDLGLHRFADAVLRATGTDVQRIAGAGAAGGLGGSLAALLGATLKPGIEMVLDAVRFDDILRGASLVITGEGSLDGQTLMGKTPFGVMRRAVRRGIPVVALGGSVADVARLNAAGFLAVLPIVPGPVTLARAMEPGFAAANLSRTTSQLVRLLSPVLWGSHIDTPLSEDLI